MNINRKLYFQIKGRSPITPKHIKMESWLVDVKRVKIPRPKFGSNGRCHPCPSEPPKDYFYDDSRSEDLKMRNSLSTPSNLAKATEDLRRAIQEKL